MRARVSILLTVVLVLVALAALLGAAQGRLGSEGPASPRLALSGGRNALKIHRSGAGRAMVSASNMAPGDRAKGRVTVRVSRTHAHASLRAGRVDREPGPRGGALSKVLRVRVLALNGGRARTLYSGRARGLRADLGSWRPGTERNYRIVSQLPRSVGNRMQGAATSFRLVWRAFPIPGSGRSGRDAVVEFAR